MMSKLVTEKLTGTDPTEYLPAPELFNKKELHKQLRRIRQDKEVTQRSISLSVFGNCDRYGHMERGNEPISEAQLEMIMKELGADKGS